MMTFFVFLIRNVELMFKPAFTPHSLYTPSSKRISALISLEPVEIQRIFFLFNHICRVLCIVTIRT